MENKCEYNVFHHKAVAVFLSLSLLFLALFLALEARNAWTEHDYIGKSAEVPYSISIKGEGIATMKPDVAKVSLGVRTEKATVEKAQEENTEKMNQIIVMLEEQEIEEKDMRTTNYNVNPKYDWNDGDRKVVGYYVNQAVEVTIRDHEKINTILKLAADNGANDIGSLRFEIDDEEELKQEARAEAIANAKEKADELAKQLDVKLGKIISFSESQNGYIDMPQYKAMADEAYGLGGGEEAPRIQTGENEITVNVSLTYEIL